MVDYESLVRTEPERIELGADPAAIAAFSRAVGDGHARHVAAAGAVAPPTYGFVLAMAGGAFAFPTEGLIHAEQSFTYEAPLVAGETLVLERALRRARRRGDGDGAMWILTWEASARTRDGRPVLAMASRLLVRPAGTDAGAAHPPAPAGEPPSTLRGPEVLVDEARIAAYADASGDRNPIHLDAAMARRYGLAGVIAHGMLSMAIVASLAEEWAREGDGGALTALRARFVAPVRAGERVFAASPGGADAEAAFGLWSTDGEEKLKAAARRAG